MMYQTNSDNTGGCYYGNGYNTQTIGVVVPAINGNALYYQQMQEMAFRQAQTQGASKMTGNKPVVICNGQSFECKDMDEAQSKAETLAHQHSADAFILKPIKKIAPKRDTVTTDLP